MDPEITNSSLKKLSKFIKKEFAIQVEKGIYDFSKDYADSNETPFLLENIYNTKLDEILEALCDNTEIIKNEKSSYNLAFLKPDELNPSKYDSLLKKKEITEYKKNDIKSSSAFKCSKCKKSKCKVTEKQIRAGDEPPTTFVNCLECGYTFSFN